MSIRVGCTVLRGPDPSYSRKLSFAEFVARAPLPKTNTLKRWRADAKPGFAFALNVPQSAFVSPSGPFRLDDATRKDMKWVEAAAAALVPERIVLETPASFTTGVRDKELFGAFLEGMGSLRERVIWSPTGIWEMTEAARYAEKIGIGLAWDPADSAATVATEYARVRALGHRSKLGQGLLENIVEAIESSEIEDMFVVLDSPTAFRAAVQLNSLLAGVGEDSNAEGEDEDLDDEDSEEDSGESDDDFEDSASDDE